MTFKKVIFIQRLNQPNTLFNWLEKTVEIFILEFSAECGFDNNRGSIYI